MIKIKEESEKRDFPIIKRNKTLGELVLFVDENTGVVIQDRPTSPEVGFCLKIKPGCFSDKWEHFKGEVIIKQ